MSCHSLCFSSQLSLIPTKQHRIGRPSITLYKSHNSISIINSHKIHSRSLNSFLPTKKSLNSRSPIIVKCCSSKDESFIEKKGTLENSWLDDAASLYPLYVTVGGIFAFMRPTTFTWFGPTSYSLTLGLIMLLYGISLDLKDFNLFVQRPLPILFGFAAQYTIMPASGVIVSKFLGFPPPLSTGLILLSCCPGGASLNMVRLKAQGDVPLSRRMRICTTLGTVILTPLLCKILAGSYVPIDVVKLSITTLQVGVAPILLGCYLQSAFPKATKRVTPFAPGVASGSHNVFSENAIDIARPSLLSFLVPDSFNQAMSFTLIVVTALPVLLLHSSGFFVGYLSAAFGGFKEPQRRATSIEVGMANSLLGVVLATTHFKSPMVALPSAVSIAVMMVMDSIIGYIWSGR